MVVLDDDGQVAGVLSQRDIFYGALAWSTGLGLFAHENAMKGIAVKEVMHEDPAVTSPGAALTEAAATMLDRKIGCLPVVQGEELVGILTEGDFLAMLL